MGGCGACGGRDAQNRLGIMGHYYNGMLDVYADAALQSVVFELHRTPRKSMR
jgi:hypothetical protein